MFLPTPPVVITIDPCDCDEEGPKHVHRYRLMNQIGVGGMGAVFKAVDVDPPAWYRTEYGTAERFVAVKYLNPGMLTGSDADRKEIKTRFHREAHAVEGIDHPNVVGVQNHGEDHEGRPLIVMDYIAHANVLSDVIQAAREQFDGGLRRHPITRKVQGSLIAPGTMFQILHQLLQALEVLHARGLVHRDLKPDNCLITGDRLRLTDFGIVKILEPRQKGLKTQIKLTAEGTILGTPYYMSPEQTGSPVVEPETKKFWYAGTYSDIWSFGVIMYEMISGGVPFDGNNPVEIVALIRDAAVLPRPLAELVTDLQPELESLVNDCLRHNPWERPQTITEVRERFERAMAASRKASGAVTVSSKPPPDEPDADQIISSVRQVGTILPPKHEAPSRVFKNLSIVLGIALAVSVTWIVARRESVDEIPSPPVSSVVTPVSSLVFDTKEARMVPPAPMRTVQPIASVPTPSKRTPDPGPLPASSMGREFIQGRAAYDQGSCATAETKMSLVLVAYPAYPEPFLVLAKCALRRGQIEKARVNARKYAEFEGVRPLPDELAVLLK